MLGLILTMVVGSVGFLVLFPFFARALARHNLFFTVVDEGRAKAILHNQAFSRAVMTYSGFHLDERWNVCQGTEGRKRYWSRLYGKLMGGGLKFVGIWPFDTVYAYDFRWDAPKKAGEVGSHDENLDYVFVKSAVYYTKLEKVETKGMVPLDIEMNITIRVTNPYRALFRTHQWLEFATNRLAPYIRQFIPVKKIEFETLIGTEQLPDGPLFKFLERRKGKLSADEKEKLREEVKAGRMTEKQIEDAEREGRGILWTLREIYGVDIQGIEFPSIATTGEAYETAAAKKWSAEREKERIEVEAAADVERMDRVYGKIASYGETGMALKTLETIEKASNKSGNWILSLDWLKGVVEGALGGKKGGNTP